MSTLKQAVVQKITALSGEIHHEIASIIKRAAHANVQGVEEEKLLKKAGEFYSKLGRFKSSSPLVETTMSRLDKLFGLEYCQKKYVDIVETNVFYLFKALPGPKSKVTIPPFVEFVVGVFKAVSNEMTVRSDQLSDFDDIHTLFFDIESIKRVVRTQCNRQLNSSLPEITQIKAEWETSKPGSLSLRQDGSKARKDGRADAIEISNEKSKRSAPVSAAFKYKGKKKVLRGNNDDDDDDDEDDDDADDDGEPVFYLNEDLAKKR